MAVKSVQRVLESFQEVKNCGTKAAFAHMKLTARMVISMTLTDISEGRQPPIRVSTVASLSPAATGSLLDDVSMDVTMPRILWLVFSHCLSPISSKTSTLVRSRTPSSTPLASSHSYNCTHSNTSTNNPGYSVTFSLNTFSHIHSHLPSNRCAHKR